MCRSRILWYLAEIRKFRANWYLAEIRKFRANPFR
jgi:hypothetical protein